LKAREDEIARQAELIADKERVMAQQAEIIA